MTGRAVFFGAVSMLGLTAAGTAHAQAFYLQEQSVRAQGRAFSGEAADTGVDSIWWNPSAIAGMQGGEGSIHASAILPRGKVSDSGTVIVRPGTTGEAVGGDAVSRNPINNGVLPSGAIAYGFGKVALGLAISTPYNFTTDYSATSWTRYTADKTELRTFDIQPTIAVQLAPGINLGAGLNVEYAKATLSNYLPNLSSALDDGHQELKGDGWDIGWSVGAQVHRGPVSVGLAYKSAIEHKLTGTLTNSGLLYALASSNYTVNTHATFKTPWQAIGSVRVQASPKLTLNAQVIRYGWSEFDTIDLGDPVNASIPENYKDTWSFAGGVDYKVDPKWTVRAGLQYGQTPTRDGERDARVPDSNRLNFSAGASYQASKHFTVDAAASYIAFKDTTIDRTTAAYAGTAAQTPILVDGTLTDASALVFSLGARVTF
ncbi:outer membrane protein transport protein [Novosphingobium sp. 1949]|uniref:Outer membrane protein transport protein n=2 Tax=Novosphingobium organovorum TaxID=2930092 RepID=A0ABT0BEQ0_9SPHN|nr:outer membrane protein transport protein [Novosphingobium organovorum]MCJ2183375.1 outer membrane protein transport protein [Novosphingobium organovorum]